MSALSMQSWSQSGLRTVPHLRWGSHLAHFFNSGDELRDVLVPYFKAGLDNNERCLWVTGRAFNAEQARGALRAAVPDLDRRERDKQIEIADGAAWYATGAKLQPEDLIGGLVRQEEDALGRGFAGLRTSGDCTWAAGQGASGEGFADFVRYEKLVQQAVRGRRMICMCSYCTDDLRNGSHAELLECHDLAVSPALRADSRQRSGAGAAADGRDTPVERALREALERQKRTFDLAMTASRMGTWRYTFADNICVYDENAQRLYGLTEARFLHDEAGAKSIFHPDDLPLMWSRVTKALDPSGDGRYEVEYRVRQPDGGWRWLSAWGLVEFEDDGGEKKPVAISGASRDLTERKQAEQLQRMLLDELNHRVKNTLASIQAITQQTLSMASDLPSARDALDRRMRSMAKAHDLLTLRAWSGANLQDVVSRALDAFAPSQVNVSGAAVDVSPKQVLGWSLALHELATNATKYGALSRTEGRVNVQWCVRDGMVHFDWEESGGPPVVPPSHKGFGSRLLEKFIGLDLGGHTKLRYDLTGVRCAITAELEARTETAS